MIGKRWIESAGLTSVELSPDELILVAHPDHPLSQLKRVTPTQLAKYRYMRRGPEFSAERHVRKMVGETYDRFEVLNLGHHEYVRAATIAGLGFAALPRRAVVADLRSGLLKSLPVPPMVRSICAVRRPSRGGPAQEAFWTQLTGAHPAASGKISSDGWSQARA